MSAPGETARPRNGGVIPDNVGPDGVVGSQLDGRWYGGHYGWTWPHGWYSVGQAATVAALAAAAPPVTSHSSTWCGRRSTRSSARAW